MAKTVTYIVLRHDERYIILSPWGSLSRRLGANEAETMITKASVTSVSKDGATLHIGTTGSDYEVFMGNRKAQTALTREAFGMPPR